MEKYGIGRPSTYAYLLKKILEYKYVIIGDTGGYKKEILEMRLSNKKITENIKNKIIGNEKQKYMITEIGLNTIDFLNNKIPNPID